ncbi:hypothetical protein KBB49_03295 [Candidatus Saccharibacteria bacterium]|nr:hypothetical protein [Candidatus Saccharibacteria bacterium]
MDEQQEKSSLREKTKQYFELNESQEVALLNYEKQQREISRKGKNITIFQLILFLAIPVNIFILDYFLKDSVLLSTTGNYLGIFFILLFCLNLAILMLRLRITGGLGGHALDRFLIEYKHSDPIEKRHIKNFYSVFVLVVTVSIIIIFVWAFASTS